MKDLYKLENVVYDFPKRKMLKEQKLIQESNRRN